MTETAAVIACRKALMTAALHGDVDLMADLHARLDHLTCLRRMVPEQRSPSCAETVEASAADTAVVQGDVVTSQAAGRQVRQGLVADAR